MIAADSPIADFCFAVYAALEGHHIPGVLTGGSAAALYAPQAYLSQDADFVLDNDDPIADVALALRSIGFRRIGSSRMFSHPDHAFTVDFPKGPLGVGGEYVRETALLERGNLHIRILTRTDCVRDRLAHFFFWNDYTALNAAVAVAALDRKDVDMNAVRTWTARESPALLEKLAEFERRLRDSH